MDTTDAWCCWLFDDMERQLAEASAAGLPADGLALTAAHVLHGLRIGLHVCEAPRLVMAFWLRELAHAVEHNTPYMPVLVLLNAEEAPHAGRA
ncbi:hypothetical protein [Azospirillum isscasi]|uniref:Uncharacterized protein n=1 Tax=Azospirillum isscasi TaxID=3053926 RepID=A0ABU0WJN0_9PROT|nr:hypothetical protein [Azospirillum isscasi]MDQ2104430.1 hypothetical protein [Azospirillum isscasi]